MRSCGDSSFGYGAMMTEEGAGIESVIQIETR
jgi:hypothetical protein